MSKMIQVRNVPEPIHRRLKSQAALEGKSLSEFLLAELKKIAEKPTLREMLLRIASDPEVRPSESLADVIREGRSERGSRG